MDQCMYVDNQFNTETHNISIVYVFTLSVYNRSKPGIYVQFLEIAVWALVGI